MLKPKQEQFCIEYVKCGNAATAYQRAYRQSNRLAATSRASKILQRPEIQSRIKELNDAMTSEKILTAEEVQERLSAIAKGEVLETVVLPNGTLTTKPAAVRDVLKALELLAKCKGLFVSKQELTLKDLKPVIIIDDIGK